MIIRAVLGDIEASKLKKVSMHEHCLRFLFGIFVKKLVEKGVSPEDIIQITEKNPPLALSISRQ
ncbi:MAG TPA: hypothetical protein DCK79_02785 [Candidatus Atribacteria bacterium]|jgi:predicted metal-dependent phosphotriesterase family hydrolase|nr:hypothetical protein [Candidatus Atribacteria bacterium]